MKKKRATRTTHRVSRSIESSPVLTFAARDAHDHPKNQLWYLGIGVLLLAVLAGLYQAREYLLMLVVVALGAAVFRLAGTSSREQVVRINQRGISFGETFHPYFQLRAFWLAEHSDTVSVYIERLNFSPTLHFVVPENRAEELVEYLADHLPWHHHRNEPLGDRLGRLLRF